MTTPLQFIAPLFVIFAAMVMGTERRLVRALRRGGALSPETAVLADTSNPIKRWRTARLRSAGVMRMAGDRVYLDEGGWKQYQHNRRKRVLIALVVVLTLFVILVATGVIRMR
jgi:hypothetical protein